MDLFDDTPRPDVDWRPDWLAPAQASALLQRLLDEVDWRQDVIRVPGGAQVPLPRLTAWQGEPDAVYVYSGIRNVPQPWSPAVEEMRRQLERDLGLRFDSVLLNRYRDGNDALGWHADDERSLGPEPTIASVSLGATRRFEMRSRDRGPVLRWQLSHGSLLVMKGRTQHDWVHRVPRERGAVGERVNLTFRRVVAPQARGRTSAQPG